MFKQMFKKAAQLVLDGFPFREVGLTPLMVSLTVKRPFFYDSPYQFNENFINQSLILFFIKSTLHTKTE